MTYLIILPTILN